MQVFAIIHVFFFHHEAQKTMMLAKQQHSSSKLQQKIVSECWMIITSKTSNTLTNIYNYTYTFILDSFCHILYECLLVCFIVNACVRQCSLPGKCNIKKIMKISIVFWCQVNWRVFPLKALQSKWFNIENNKILFLFYIWLGRF